MMPHVDILYNQLQSRQTDAVKLRKCILNFNAQVQQLRENVSDLSVAAESQNSNTGDAHTPLKEDKIPRHRQQRNNAQTLNVVAAKEVCDLILAQANDRFEYTDHLEAAMLVFEEKFESYCSNFPTRILDVCVKAFPMLEKDMLRTELAILYSRQEFRCTGGAIQQLQLILESNLEPTFPQVVKLLRILITMPMTTSESERCFSTLKRIKTFLRSTMSEERLCALAMLSIEKEMIAEIPNFNERVIDRFATTKNRRMDFIFK